MNYNIQVVKQVKNAFLAITSEQIFVESSGWYQNVPYRSPHHTYMQIRLLGQKSWEPLTSGTLTFDRENLFRQFWCNLHKLFVCYSESGLEQIYNISERSVLKMDAMVTVRKIDIFPRMSKTDLFPKIFRKSFLKGEGLQSLIGSPCCIYKNDDSGQKV